MRTLTELLTELTRTRTALSEIEAEIECLIISRQLDYYELQNNIPNEVHECF